MQLSSDDIPHVEVFENFLRILFMASTITNCLSLSYSFSLLQSEAKTLS